MTSRREALQMLVAITASGAVRPALAMKKTETAMGRATGIQFGAQTNAWAIDPKNLDSFFDVLGQIKRVGYAGFETGFFNLKNHFASPKDAAQRIAATGLVFYGIHVFIPFDKVDPATLLPALSIYEQAAQGGKALGAQRLILSGAPAVTEQDLDRKIRALNTAGKFADNLGLGFAYHNHWGEFQSKIDEIETLYQRTNPSVVSFLLDAGHAWHGGANVPEFLRKHSQRIVGIHLRDAKDGHPVPLGEGTFPLAEVAATLKELRWQGWVINEEEREDGTKAGLRFIEPAFKAMQGAFTA
jgi:inosose dehydratase